MLAALGLAVAGTAVAGTAGAAEPRPAPLQALEKRGLAIVGSLPAPGALSAYAGYLGQQPLAVYVTPDGQHAIVGTLLDAQGRDLTRTALDEATARPMADATWQRLEKSHWIADGRDDAPRKVYVFTDPNCPYCNKLWSDARPWVDTGRVQLRHVMVGILTPSSAAKAAALLADANPAAALAAHARAHAAANGKALAGGRPRPLGDAGVKPLASVPPALQAKLEANAELMLAQGLQATPAVAWRDEQGRVQMRQGVPEAALPTILGAR